MDTAAQDACLNAWLGANKAAGMPASLTLGLFDGYPEDDLSNEVTGGGYGRATVATDGATWPAAVDGLKTAATVDLVGTSTYTVAGTHWRLFSGTTVYFTGALDEAVSEPTDDVVLTIALTDET